jgi:hypothetical protein
MIEVAKLKQWADDCDEAAQTLLQFGARRIEATVMKTRAQEIREEIATLDRMERIDGSIAKRLSENISHNIELRAGLESLKHSLRESDMKPDHISYFTNFIDQLLARRLQAFRVGSNPAGKNAP